MGSMTRTPPAKVHELLAISAEKWGDRPAIVDASGSLDFQTLLLQVEDVSQQLVTLGVGPGQGIGIMAPSGREFVIGAFAALYCGATVMPISHQIKPSEMEAMFANEPLHGILYDKRGLRPLNGHARPVQIAGKAEMDFAWSDTDRSAPYVRLVPDAAFVRYTSGTTGKARGVIMTHEGVLARTAAANQGLKLGCDDTVVWVLPMAFHFFVSIVLYLRYGVTIAICPDHFAETILDVANRHGGTLLYASPLHYRLLASTESDTRFHSLQRAISTSTLLPTQTAVAFRRRHGLPITQALGVIEVGLPLINLTDAWGRPESVGRPLPDFSVTVLDENFCPVAHGEIGQLAIRGPGMFAGYLRPPVTREEVLQDGWFLTGDLASRGADGLYTIVGRCKSLINVAGNKVFPEEVEFVLAGHPEVKIARVSGRPHPQMGEVVHAEVVARDTTTPPDAEKLIRFCRERLSGFRVPASIDFVDRIEETTSSKIRRC